MTHYKNSLLNNSGEGHIDTGIKIIIGIVIGALILGGLYALFATVILPQMNDEVDQMMDYEDVFHPVTKEAREALVKHVIDGYNHALEQAQTRSQAPVQSSGSQTMQQM